MRHLDYHYRTTFSMVTRRSKGKVEPNLRLITTLEAPQFE